MDKYVATGEACGPIRLPGDDQGLFHDIVCGKNLATALSRHGIEPGSLIPVESQILSTEPQQLARDI